MDDRRPVPDIADPEYAPFWSAAADHRLSLPCCGSCGRTSWPPRPVCPRCHADDWRWREHEPRGTLVTWVVVGLPTVSGFEDVPYVVAIIELDGFDDPVRLVGELIGPSEDLVTGLAVSGAHRDRGPGIAVLEWTPDFLPTT